MVGAARPGACIQNGIFLFSVRRPVTTEVISCYGMEIILVGPQRLIRMNTLHAL